MTEMTSVGNDYIGMEDNLTWLDEDQNLWKAWVYNVEKNRYYFDDIGNESLAGLWSDEFLSKADL
jgi:hypothetical protein